MKFIYAIVVGLGWGYLSNTFHWPFRVAVVAEIMTIAFAAYVSRVVEDDRHG